MLDDCSRREFACWFIALLPARDPGQRHVQLRSLVPVMRIGRLGAQKQESAGELAAFHDSVRPDDFGPAVVAQEMRIDFGGWVAAPPGEDRRSVAQTSAELRSEWRRLQQRLL